MAAAPLMLAGGALGGMLGLLKKKKKGEAQPTNAEPTGEVTPPVEPVAASQSTSEANKAANTVMQRAKRRAMGNSGIVTPRGGIGGVIGNAIRTSGVTRLFGG